MNKEVIADNPNTMPCATGAHKMSQARQRDPPRQQHLSISKLQQTHPTYLSFSLSPSIYISITNLLLLTPSPHTSSDPHPHKHYRNTYYIHQPPHQKCANKPSSQSTAPAAPANLPGEPAGPRSAAAASSSGSAATAPSSRAGSTSSRISAMAAS